MPVAQWDMNGDGKVDANEYVNPKYFEQAYKLGYSTKPLNYFDQNTGKYVSRDMTYRNIDDKAYDSMAGQQSALAATIMLNKRLLLIDRD